MSQCDKHFDDSTAHATVEWFLSQLLNSEQVDLAFLDDVCRDLNAVHFIDCLREQVAKRKYGNEHFERIKDIANRLDQDLTGLPNLSVLLLSITRDSFDDSQNQPLRIALISVVKTIYDDYMKESKNCSPDSKCVLCDSRAKDEKSPFCESRFLVFRAGCQLLHFENDEWKSEFAKFRRFYSEEISKFRMLYYSTDNTAVFTRRVIARWERVSNPVAREFTNLEKYHDLNPLLFELPIKARSAEGFKFANHKKIGGDFAKKLSEQFRIVQWELLVRNLVEEAIEGRLCFHPITDEHDIPGKPDNQYLIDFINDARKVEWWLIPSGGEIPTKKRYGKNSLSTKEITLDALDSEKVTQCYISFNILLTEISNSYRFVHEDLVNAFGNLRASDGSSNERSNTINTMLIEDGELSFFSLLWLLRYARYTVEKNGRNWKSELKDWQSLDTDKKFKIRFRPGFHTDEGKLARLSASSDWIPSEVDWSECNFIEFAEECGLIILITVPERKRIIPTRRWRSLIKWLRRFNDDLSCESQMDIKVLNSEQSLYFDNSLLRQLPVKRLDHDTEKSCFVRKLWRFLASKELKDMLNKLDVISDASMSRKDFAEKFGGLIQTLDPLLEVKSSAGLEDTVLLGCSRGFVPLEHLFRAYNPCELHLLFQALNWEESHLGKQTQSPISIGAATIAGRVESDPTDESNRSQDAKTGQVEERPVSKGNSKSLEATVSDFDRWMDPYRSLFSVLSADFSLPAVQESSEKIGVQTGTETQQRYFAHQTAGLFDMIALDQKWKELGFHSKFALWLARTQVIEIWGGFPIDTRELIHKEIPAWMNFTEREIVEGLVNLSLVGGIIRATKAPKTKSGGTRDRRRRLFTDYARKELQPPLALAISNNDSRQIEQVAANTLSQLSFCLPKDISLPGWVNTKAFAICFYQGMRQAVYHALETFVLIDEKNTKDR